MQVDVITRVNIKMTKDYEPSEQRKALFFDWVVPAMKQQTYKDFRRIGLFDINTPEKEIEKYKEAFDVLYYGEGNTVYDIYKKEHEGKEVLSIRLDTDDIPSPYYVGAFVSSVDKLKRMQVLIANKGTDNDIRTGERVNIQVDRPIAFIGIYEKELRYGCYGIVQSDLKDYDVTYLSDYTDKLLWTRLIHGENWSDTALLTKYRICTKK